MNFEWDDKKEQSNLKKHCIHFSEAVTIWLDYHSLEMSDPEHSGEEDRWLRLGMSKQAKIILVVYVERYENTIRIISARRASKNETKEYLKRINI